MIVQNQQTKKVEIKKTASLRKILRKVRSNTPNISPNKLTFETKWDKLKKALGHVNV